MSRRIALVVGNTLGFLFLLTAGSGGLGFLNRGDDIESFVMAAGFILAFIAYGATMYKTKNT
jgi:small neutral amino acid transporter SnatA (MarC family)